jgi:membrane protein
MEISQIKSKTSELLEQVSKDEIFTRASSLAFYTLFSFGPLALLFVVFLNTLDLDFQHQLISQIRNLMGQEAAELFESAVASAKDRPDLSSASGWIGTGVLLFSASLIFVQIQTTLNQIFDTARVNPANPDETLFQSARKMVVDRLVSIGVLLSGVFIAIVSLGMSSAISYIVGESEQWWSQVLNEGISLAVFSILFAVIYKWMPDRDLKTSNTLLGGFITACLFVLGKFLIGLYLGQAAVGSAYGAAGSLAVLLIWVYYSSIVFFLGAEISYVTLVNSEAAE